MKFLHWNTFELYLTEESEGTDSVDLTLKMTRLTLSLIFTLFVIYADDFLATVEGRVTAFSTSILTDISFIFSSPAGLSFHRGHTFQNNFLGA